MTSEVDNTNSHRGIVNAAEAFAGGFIDVFKRPAEGAAQLALSRQRPPERPQEQGWAADAGSMLGNATLFIGSQMLLSRIPFASRVAPYLLGGGVGFLEPTRANEGLGTRVENGLLGAATIGMLDFGPRAMSASGFSFLPKSDLGRFVLTNGLAGALNAQASTRIQTGDWASAQNTLVGAGTWMTTGALFHGIGRLTAPQAANTDSTGQRTLWNAKTDAGRPQPLPAPLKDIAIPALELGEPSSYEHARQVPFDSPLGRTWTRASQAVVRVESLNVTPAGLGGGIATAFATRDGAGNLRFVSTNHLVDGAVDVTIRDGFNNLHKADVLARNEPADLSILRLRDPAAEANFQTLELGARQIDTKDDTSYAAFGFANGWDRMFASVGKATLSPRPGFEYKMALNGEEGLCGAPIMNLDAGKGEGEVVAVYKNADRHTNDISTGTPVSFVKQLLKQQEAADPPRPPAATNHTALSFNIDDPAAGSLNLQAIFGRDFWRERPADFYHLRARNLPIGTEHNGGELTVRAQYHPRPNQVLVEPVALNRQPLRGDELWPGTNLPIHGARLTVDIDSHGLPTDMRGNNDPLNVLSRALARPTSAYLADLDPQITSLAGDAG